MAKNQMPTQKLLTLLIDIFILLIIGLLGWFLIGRYTLVNFLSTGYQDWIFHAFKIKSLSLHGITSWDRTWANGLNHWRAYQYLPHWLTWQLSLLSDLTIPQAMLWITVTVFISTRIIIYLSLRILKIHWLFAFIAALISYDTAQQWQAMQDYSIFLATIWVPVYMFVWIKVQSHTEYWFLFSALAGLSWSIHPVWGWLATVIWMITWLWLWTSLKRSIKAISGAFFFFSALPFFSQYFSIAYKFSNPYLQSVMFIRTALQLNYLGSSLAFIIFSCLSWILVWFPHRYVPVWSRRLLVIITIVWLLIWLAYHGYTPGWLNKFQFARSNTLLTVISVYAIAGILSATRGLLKSLFVRGWWAVIIAAIVIDTVSFSSSLSAGTLIKYENPVDLYFQTHSLPTGSVYIADVSSASYMADDSIKFPTSYNEHLLPSPLSLRYRILMKPDVAMSGVSQRHLQLINSYSQVLGVEYFFLPINSPWVTGLSGNPNSEFYFQDQIVSQGQKYAVLKSKRPPQFAYLINSAQAQQNLSWEALPLPNLSAESYHLWDDQVVSLAKFLNQPSVRPVPVDFPDVNKLTIDPPANSFSSQYGLLIMQNWDPSWELLNQKTQTIKPINLRFMWIDPLPSSAQVLQLINQWPVWHWPVQAVGLLSLITGLYCTGFLSWRNKGHHLAAHSHNPHLPS